MNTVLNEYAVLELIPHLHSVAENLPAIIGVQGQRHLRLEQTAIGRSGEPAQLRATLIERSPELKLVQPLIADHLIVLVGQLIQTNVWAVVIVSEATAYVFGERLGGTVHLARLHQIIAHN